MEIITRKLVVLSSVAKGASFLLTGIQVGIGREEDNAICLEDDLISRHHAALIRHNGEYILRDLDSMNGTFLNGRRASELILKLGDRIRIGGVEMGYEAVTVSAPVERAEKSTAEPTTELKSARRAASQPKKPATSPDELRQAAEQLALLSKENRALTAKLFALEAERKNVESPDFQRLTIELAQTRDAAHRLSLLAGDGRETGEAELLEKNKQLLTRLEAIETVLERMRPMAERGRMEELEHVLAELLRVRTALTAVAEFRAPAVRLARENEELRKALGKAHEEIAVAHRCLSDRTEEEFGRLRQSMVEKSAVAEPRGVLGHLSAAKRALRLD
jgi:hypothetical protein